MTPTGLVHMVFIGQNVSVINSHIPLNDADGAGTYGFYGTTR